jgi:hypothetical protein
MVLNQELQGNCGVHKTIYVLLDEHSDTLVTPSKLGWRTERVSTGEMWIEKSVDPDVHR